MRYAQFAEAPRPSGAVQARRQRNVNYAATLLKTHMHRAGTAYAAGHLTEAEFLTQCEERMGEFVATVTQQLVVDGGAS